MNTELLKRLWLEGVPGTEIARLTGAKVNRVYKRAKRLGLPSRARKSRHPKHTGRACEFRTMWLDKSKSLRDVSRAFEVDKKTATRWAKSMGLATLRRLDRPPVPVSSWHNERVYLPSEEEIYATAALLREKWPPSRGALDMVPS